MHRLERLLNYEIWECVKLPFFYLLQMGKTRSGKQVSWAIQDHEGVVILKTIRHSRKSCVEDFKKEILPTLFEKKYTWQHLTCCGWRSIRVIITVYEPNEKPK